MSIFFRGLFLISSARDAQHPIALDAGVAFDHHLAAFITYDRLEDVRGIMPLVVEDFAAAQQVFKGALITRSTSGSLIEESIWWVEHPVYAKP
jgi:hypothetical protein